MIHFFFIISLVLTPITAFSADLQVSEEAIFATIFEEQLKLFSYRNESNPTLIVMFSGTPGMGKTTIAECIEKHFHGIRISSDAVRRILRDHQVYNEKLVHRYMLWCVEKFFTDYPNHLIILDCSVDRTYDLYIKTIQGQGIDTFLIRMKVERHLVEERIRLRGRDVEPLLQGADRSWHDYEVFGQSHEPDFIFDNNENADCTLRALFDNIEQIYTYIPKD